MLGEETLYCDGGNITPNPSRVGGTWAWCHVSAQGDVLHTHSGIVLPSMIGLPAVSSNVSELLAALFGMEHLPPQWEGTIASDSLITIRRLDKEKKKQPRFVGVPAWLAHRFAQAKYRLGPYRTVLLGGHPSQQDLANGIRTRDGLPVSQHNVWCDTECQRQAKLYRNDPQAALQQYAPNLTPPTNTLWAKETSP